MGDFETGFWGGFGGNRVELCTFRGGVEGKGINLALVERAMLQQLLRYVKPFILSFRVIFPN